jgi:hypothetical protein
VGARGVRALYRDRRESEGNDLPETRARTWIGSVEDLPVLEHALANGEPLVREHAVWALAQIAAR